MSALFTPFTLRKLTFRNRVFVSPMCQYSSQDGLPNDWHMVHLGSRAVGGAGLVMTEAAAVAPEGRISPRDLGIWSDEQAEALKPIARFIRDQGAVAAIQLAHAGRKASTSPPWEGGHAVGVEMGGWQPVAPSAVAFNDRYALPRALRLDELAEIPTLFARAAQRSVAAGFQVAEIHAAHGYLLHQFLSPLSNQRSDAYGGSFENRVRLTLEVVKAVRDAWPGEWPLFVRVSATDWVEGGWDLAQSVALAKQLGALGVDLIDTSSGGVSPQQKIELKPGYQVPFACALREQAGIATGAVGLISEPAQAEAIVREGQADVVLLARAFLRDPYWTRRAALALGADSPWPVQYARA